MTQEQFKSLKRYCARPECGKLLTQNVGEMLSMFSKRETCGRGCSSKIRGMSLRGKPQNRKPVVKKQTEEERLGLVQYKQGTAEFEAIAALYMK